MEIDEEDIPDATCIKLFDGKLSVRLEGREACLLPSRETCSLYDLEEAFATVIGKAIKLLPEPELEAEPAPDTEGW